MARDRRSPFETAGTQDIQVQQVRPEETLPSPVEYTKDMSGLAGATRYLAEKGAVAMEKGWEDEFAATRATTRVAAFEAFEGRSLSESEEESITSVLMQQLGAEETDDPRLVEAQQIFQKLKEGQLTGRVPTDHIKVLAQSKMRQLISENPLFEQEIRGMARKNLGFDPTGADMEEAFDILSRKGEKRELTKYEKKDLYLQQLYPKSNEDLRRSMIQQLDIQERETAHYAAKAAANTATGDDYNALANNLSANVMQEAVAEIKQLTTAEDPESSQIVISNNRQRFQAIRIALLKASSTKNADGEVIATTASSVISEAISRIDALEKVTNEMIKDGDFLKFYEEENKLILAVAEHSVNKAVKLAPEMRILFGKEMSADQISMMSAYNNSLGAQEIFLKTFPKARGFWNTMHLIEEANKGLTNVMNNIPPKDSGEELMQKVATLGVITGDETPDEKRVQVVSNYANNIGVSKTLSLFNNENAKSKVLKYPKMRQQFTSLYAEERLGRTLTLTEGLKEFKKLDKNATIVLNDQGLIELRAKKESDIPPIGLASMAIAQHAAMYIGLEQEVAKMNNIIKVTNRYKNTGIFTPGDTPESMVKAIKSGLVEEKKEEKPTE